MATIATRLPGITFETRTPPIPAVLPRMDIAGFAGFAASGPIDLPVAIEDVKRFHDIFGDDVELGRDSEAGDVVYAELGPTARTFFRDGGVRCWIVRIADRKTAITNRFPIPGLLAGTSPTGTPDGGVAFARSPGGWSDALTVNATLTLRRARVPSGSPLPGGFHIDGLVAGDLIQTDYAAIGVTGFQPVHG